MGEAAIFAMACGVPSATKHPPSRPPPGPLQQAVLSLSLGETSPPFGSIDEGVRVLMLCGRDDPQTTDEPDVNQLMAQMEDDRINKRAQMYLRDLRRDAVIDYH